MNSTIKMVAGTGMNHRKSVCQIYFLETKDRLMGGKNNESRARTGNESIAPGKN
jgi:hypothetical protein